MTRPAPQPQTDPEPARVPFERERGVYALQVTRNVAHALISVGSDDGRVTRIAAIFHALANAEIPVFLIKLHRTVVTLAFAGEDLAAVESALTESGYSARVRRDLALVMIRAASMRDLSGIMVEISDAFYEAGARLFEIGDSHNSVQCLIEGDRVEAAVGQLCGTFGLDPAACTEARLAAKTSYAEYTGGRAE